ncbi:MAG TPA: chromosome segregation SMC family protein, partial [Stellaceae bacterium]|nr:chromosome segregation SMC family protein [Stellaceae bacterium]
MHFSKLRLSGFKSFVDPTELLIEPGLTGIVGPNGCGKSNLVEALRWVMGETSAKRMRGGEMDDVIFGGTSTRPARNIAEVTLFLDNAAHDAPSPHQELDEIEVMRRIERAAGSFYRINGREMRARDVQLLFADAASGAHSAALVSQGRVGAIINAKPAERRGLLEEAAGIAGLHSRRHEAELRLNAAAANLARLEDVLTTLRTQLEGLTKQARQAQRYRRLSDHIARAEALVLHLKRSAAAAEFAAAKAEHEKAQLLVADLTTEALAAERERDACAEALPPLRQAEAEASALWQRLTLARQALEEEERRVAAALHAAELRLRELAGDMKREEELGADARAALARVVEERAGLVAAQDQEEEALHAAKTGLAAISAEIAGRESELNRITEEIATEEARRATLERQLQEASQRRDKLGERRDEIHRQRVEIEAAAIAPERLLAASRAAEEANDTLERSRTGAEAAEHALRASLAAETAARAPLQEAEMRRTKLATEGEALAELLSRGSDKRTTPILDEITVEPGFEAALGAALGDDLTAPLLTPGAAAFWRHLPDYPYSLALPGGARLLGSAVRAPAALERRLKAIGVVADGEEALRLQPALRPGQCLV